MCFASAVESVKTSRHARQVIPTLFSLPLSFCWGFLKALHVIDNGDNGGLDDNRLPPVGALMIPITLEMRLVIAIMIYD